MSERAYEATVGIVSTSSAFWRLTLSVKHVDSNNKASNTPAPFHSDYTPNLSYPFQRQRGRKWYR